MPWVLLDVLIGVFAVVVLIGTGIGLFRHVKTLLKTVSSASTRMSDAMPPPVQPHR